MPAISNLLARFGYVKLAPYGLVLTAEGRIMSLRPAILDDGLGGRIVGWPDGDLAAMELQKWEPARPASLPAPATRVAALPPPIPRIAFPKPAAVIAPAAPVAATSAPVLPTPGVAEVGQVDEDEWEWEIALARARVAADEAELAAKAVATPRVVTIPPRVEPMPSWEKTETIELEDRTRPDRPAVPAPPVTRPMPVAVIPPKRPPTAPPTVIPIPKLPTIKDRLPQIQPVVGATSNGVPSRTRFAKGTGPVEPPPPIRAGEETQPGVSPAAARNQRVPWPAPARVVSLPSVKRLSRS